MPVKNSAISNFPSRAVALPAAVIGVDVNIEIDVARLHPPIDERLAAIVERARHAEFQSHANGRFAFVVIRPSKLRAANSSIAIPP